MSKKFLDLDEVSTLAKLFGSLAHPARIAILRGVGGLSLQEIAKTVHTSPPALQRHVNSLRDAGLIEKRERSYELTDNGRRVAGLFDQFSDMLASLREKEKVLAKEKIKAVAFGSGLTKRDMVRLVEEIDKKRED
jgi:predicted transcriptional regulator